VAIGVEYDALYRAGAAEEDQVGGDLDAADDGGRDRRLLERCLSGSFPTRPSSRRLPDR
jgi:hypothetical protein